MPYFVSTFPHGELPFDTPYVCATIQEARELATAEVSRGGRLDVPRACQLAKQVHAIGPEGGVVGPRADGQVTEVLSVSWETISRMVSADNTTVDAKVAHPWWLGPEVQPAHP